MMKRRGDAIVGTKDPEEEQIRDEVPGDITLDSPIEDLGLSGRARNALREAGCETVRGLLENDFSKAVRRLGPVTLEEITSLLTARGFGVPPTLAEARNERISELQDELSRLRENINSTSRQWQARVERLEHRLDKLSTEPRSV